MSAFASAVMQASRRTRVRTMYRKLLIATRDQLYERRIWLLVVDKIRKVFENAPKEENKLTEAFDRGDYWLNLIRDPEPYTIPTQKGGSAFDRDPPLPLGVTIFEEEGWNESLLGRIVLPEYRMPEAIEESKRQRDLALEIEGFKEPSHDSHHGSHHDSHHH